MVNGGFVFFAQKGTIQLHDTVRYLMFVGPLSSHSKIEFHVPLLRSPRVQYFET